MYIQITTRCNMSCEHCCFACDQNGDDMTIDTFKKCIEFAEKYDDIIFLGGGEPTIHPKFWEILMLSFMADIDDYRKVSMVTNGSITDISLKLAILARRGFLYVDLSQDVYHDPIDERVIRAFNRNKNDENDLRRIRNVEGNEINAGRCNFGLENRCVCPDIHVSPNGDISQCGCLEAPILGNVWELEKLHELEFTSLCYKYQDD